jgi:hypothetical protein
VLPTIAYFDSNIYQHIRELGGEKSPEFREITDAIRRGCLRVFLSISNLNALAAGYLANPGTARANFEITKALCMRRPTREVRDLIQREVQRYQDRSVELKIHESVESLNGSAFLFLWDLRVTGENLSLITEKAAEAQDELKALYMKCEMDAHDQARLGMSWRGRMPQGRVPSWFLWENEEIREKLLKPSLASYIPQVPLKTTAQELWDHLDECPGLKAQFSYFMHLFINALIRGRKP